MSEPNKNQSRTTRTERYNNRSLRKTRSIEILFNEAAEEEDNPNIVEEETIKSTEEINTEIEIEELNISEYNESIEEDNISENSSISTLKIDMGEPISISDFARPTLDDVQQSIVRPNIQRTTFEIKTSLIQMIQNNCQFDGRPDEDPNTHIAGFIEICDTFKINNVSDDAIRLRLFPFSLRDRAKIWLQSLPSGSITTWNQMVEKFLLRYFPPSKTAKLRSNITSFNQHDGETLYETWERFKDLLRKCPHHGLPVWLQVSTFYNGLLAQDRQNIDAASGGAITSKTPEAAYNLIEEMALNSYQWQADRKTHVKGIHKLDDFTSLTAKYEALALSVEQLKANKIICELCGGPHKSTECQQGNMFARTEEVDYINYQNQNQYQNQFQNRQQNYRPINNNFKPNTNPPGFGNQPYQPQQNFQQNQQSQGQDRLSKLENMFEKYLVTANKFEVEIRNNRASILNLENMIGELSNKMNNREQGNLPSDTIPNPKEEVKSVTLRSGRITENKDKNQTQIIEEDEIPKEKEEVEAEIITDKDKNKDKEKDKLPENTEVKETLKPYQPKIPFPARINKEKEEGQYKKFLEILKQLHINLPFIEAIAQMPKYSKFLKDLLTNKNKLEEITQVTLNECCSLALQNRLPEKMSDPGCFTIPCKIGNLQKNALADLGASISIMPYSIFKKLNIGEPKPTRMNIQLADRSITYPKGIVENLLVKIDKFVFPVDFVILEMSEDKKIPLILGRPFLLTARTLINLADGQITLRVNDESVVINVDEVRKQSMEQNEMLNCINVVYPLKTDEPKDLEITESIRKQLIIYQDGKNNTESVIPPKPNPTNSKNKGKAPLRDGIKDLNNKQLKTNRLFEPGNKVSLYHIKKSKWSGPYKIQMVENGKVELKNRKGIIFNKISINRIKHCQPKKLESIPLKT